MAEPMLDTPDDVISTTRPADEVQTVERAQDFARVTVDELWAAVTEPGQLAAWLGDEVDIDLRPDGRGRVVDGEEVRELLVREVEPGRRLAFQWWPQTARPGPDTADVTEVTFLIIGIEDGSRLIVRETRPAARTGWGLRLALLAFGLDGRARW